MNVVAFNGSPKKNGNTALALQTVAEQLESNQIHTEIVHVGNQLIHGCIACGKCAENNNDQCAFRNDNVNEWIQKIVNADGLLLGSPVYFAGINGTLKSFLDRAGYVLARKRATLRYKVAAAVVAVRRSGGSAALDTLNHYIQFFEMIQPAANYWNIVHGRTPGEILKDEEGQQILKTLGNNMGWLMKTVQLGKEKIPMPEVEEKIFTHFIR
jgi:multimeric flavodoxin WrbA